MNGYFKQQRDELEVPMFDNGKPYDDFHAYSWLKAIAQYHSCNVSINSKLNIELHEHELFTSRNKLAAKWNWNEHKVSRFIKQLKINGYIDYEQIGTFGTKIKILKFECEQASEQAERSIFKGLQGVGEQASEQAVSKQTSKQVSKQNAVFSRDCEEQASKQVSKQVSNNIQEVLKNNSVCVKEPPQEFLKLFTREQYNELVNKHTQEYTDRVIREMLDYEERKQTKIANPMSLFKSWNPKKKNKQNQKQTPSQRKPGQNKFNNFQQRDYDMDELEQKLLGV